MFKSLGDTIATKSKAVYAAIKPKFESTVKMTFAKKKPDPKVLKNEIDELKVTVEHLKNSIAAGLLTGSIDTADDAVIKDAEGQVGELENELKAESQNHDILSAFYITEAEEVKEEGPVEYKVGDKVIYKSKEGKEIEKEIIKIEGDNFFFKDKEGNEFSKAKTDITGKAKSLGAKVWGGFTKWFLDMEQATPPVKGKAVWWIKLILKIVGLVLSPVVKALEIAVKFITSNILKAVSAASKYLKGPGVFEFIVLGGIVAGLPALVTEVSLLGHVVPEPFGKIFEVIAEFLAELSGIDMLLKIIGGFCAAMTFWQLYLEFKHLFGDHSGEGHGDEKAPATPGAKPEGGEAPAAPAPAA